MRRSVARCCNRLMEEDQWGKHQVKQHRLRLQGLGASTPPLPEKQRDVCSSGVRVINRLDRITQGSAFLLFAALRIEFNRLRSGVLNSTNSGLAT